MTSSPAQPSSIAGIIPPETLLSILKKVLERERNPAVLACQVHSEFTGHDSDATRVFLSTSLVCRKWREASQEMLWRSLSVFDQVTAQHVLASPLFGRLKTDSLVLMGASNVHDPIIRVGSNTAVELISGLKGLRHMELRAFRLKGLEILLVPSLSGLCSLSLQQPIVDAKGALGLICPFAVRYLHLDALRGYTFRFLSHIDPSALTSLSLGSLLDLASPEDSITLQKFLLSSAPHLLELKSLSRETTSLYYQVCTSFTALRTIHLSLHFSDEDLNAVIQRIPSELSTLYLWERPTRSVVDTVSSLLDLPALARLDVLSFPMLEHLVFGLDPGASALELILDSKGIKLEMNESFVSNEEPLSKVGIATVSG